MQLPALPAEQDTYCRARRTTQRKIRLRPGYASPAGRHENSPAALAGRGTDIRSHLCRGDMIYLRTLRPGHACRSRPQFVQT
jgi:hypothetical protein